MNHKFWDRDKAEDIVVTVKNIEATSIIYAGQPCILGMTGTDDGIGVVLPSSSSAAKVGAFFMGVAIRNMNPGQVNDCQVFGFNRNTKVIRGTRAASTDSWPSFAAITIGDLLSIDTVNNCFARSGAASNIGIKWPFNVAESMASVTTMASSVLGQNAASALVFLQSVKTFIRSM